MPGYAFAQSVTQTLSLTAADSITDTDGTFELDGARGIATFTSGNSTYAAVAAYWDDGVQILNVTDPTAITAAGSISGTGTPALDGASNIAIFESGGSTYAAVTAESDDGVQILITDPTTITARQHQRHWHPQAGRRTRHHHVHIRRQHIRGGRRIRGRRRPDTQRNRPDCHHRRRQHHGMAPPRWTAHRHRRIRVGRQHLRGSHRIYRRRRPDT